MTSEPVRNDEAEAEAALWLARLHADTRTAEDEAAFRRWVDAAPENAEAFRHLTTVWDAVGGVSRTRFGNEEREAKRLSCRAVLAGAGAVAAVGIGFGGWQRAYAGVYQTGLGEQKTVPLDDGSLVFLDTDSRIRLHFSDETRRVVLERGRANFRVARDLARPFIVEADEGRVVTPRAVFDVRRDEGRFSVMLIDGQAMVESGGSTANPINGALNEGQRMIIDPDQPGRIDMPDMAQQLAWQNGQMIADNQSLGAVAAEMNRYSRSKLTLGDPHAAGLRISGVYRVGDNAGFALAVSKVLPVGVRPHGDGLQIFSLPPPSGAELKI